MPKNNHNPTAKKSTVKSKVQAFAKSSEKLKSPSVKKSGIQRDELAQHLANYLQIAKIKDYCPNGLQVQGRDRIQKIVSGVTASQALIEAAIQAKADAILVHHGWFWKSDDPSIVGQLHARLKLLMDHNINLFAYHLPLDIHPIVGNNAQLAKVMSWKGQAALLPGMMDSLMWQANIQSMSLQQLSKSLASRLGKDPLVIGEPKQTIKKVAWCTGGAQGYIKEALSLGVDAYISGEVSEQTYHFAKEMGIAYISAGHHATERYGVQALGQYINKTYKIEHQFVDIPNPV